MAENFIDRMEDQIFSAQLARLARITGRTPHAEFIKEMYDRVKERYLEELKRRKIRLRALDAARLDEIVSYLYYYHLFHTSHLPRRSLPGWNRMRVIATGWCRRWRCTSSSTSI